MNIAGIMSRIAAELALFAGAGFLLFAINDVLVDVIYFTRRLWRGLTVYTRYPRAFASYFVFRKDPGFRAILVPAWDESAVIAPMLMAMLDRLDYDNFRIFVGQYRNDPATAAAIASVDDPRVEPVVVDADGPTTKAAYGAALLWSQIWLAEALGAPLDTRLDPTLVTLLTINAWLLAWRIVMRAYFTASAYGTKEGLLSVPRMFIGNVIAVLAAARAISLHMGGGAKRWDKTDHMFPAELPQ